MKQNKMQSHLIRPTEKTLYYFSIVPSEIRQN